jgi:hypothetical protein
MNTKPPFKPLVSTAERQRVFGKFDYKTNPDGTIRILGNWAHQNIVKVHIPQLEGVDGAPLDGVVWFHKLGVDQLKALFEEWDAEGLMDLVLTWAGSFVPRMIRGSKTVLSNHAFGTAFDINAAWNGLGKAPAPAGRKGSVIPLVEIAHKHGFYWGGNFSRSDGMHFELAVVQPSSELPAVGSSDAIQQAEDKAMVAISNSQPVVESPSQPAASNEQETPSQTVEAGAAATQVVVQPNALDSKAPVSGPFDEPIKIAKDNSGKLANWLVSGSILGTVGGFLKDNSTLIVVFFVAAVVVGLSIYFVNRYMKLQEARLKADPSMYPIEFVKESK